MSSNVFLSFWVKHCVKSFICNMWKVVIKNLSLVENRTGIVEVTGSNPIEALIFSRLPLSNCLSWKIYCDDHSSLSRTCLCLHASTNFNHTIFKSPLNPPTLPTPLLIPHCSSTV